MITALHECAHLISDVTYDLVPEVLMFRIRKARAKCFDDNVSLTLLTSQAADAQTKSHSRL